MDLEEIKGIVKGLSVEERRKIALYILELEKEHLQGTVGPQIAEDLERFSKMVQDTVEKFKRVVKENLNNRRGTT